MVQEHWKSQSDLDDIMNFSDHYVGYGISAMSSTLEKGVLRGRPYGGSAILVKCRINNGVKLRLTTDRVVALEVGFLLIICVYMPTEYSKNAHEFYDILAEIVSVIADNPYLIPIFGGDFNCNIHETSPFSSAILSVMSDYKLITVDSQLQLTDFKSYNHPTLPNSSYVDFILLSDKLTNKVLAYEPILHALNLSDHTPIKLTLRLQPLTNIAGARPSSIENTTPKSLSRLRWDMADLANYYHDTYVNLSPLLRNMKTFLTDSNSPTDCLCNFGTKPCKTCSDRNTKLSKNIDLFYNNLIETLDTAALANIPASKPNFFKHWWDREATSLKDLAFSAYNAWSLLGRPKEGSENVLMKTTKRNYKKYLAKLKDQAKNRVTESLLNSLISKDTKTFWKSFKSKLDPRKKKDLYRRPH